MERPCYLTFGLGINKQNEAFIRSKRNLLQLLGFQLKTKRRLTIGLRNQEVTLIQLHGIKSETAEPITSTKQMLDLDALKEWM